MRFQYPIILRPSHFKYPLNEATKKYQIITTGTEMEYASENCEMQIIYDENKRHISD